MATGVYTDFKIYNDEFWAGAIEAIDQAVENFEQATRGCIRIVTQSSRGHFQKEAMLDDLANVVTRRDISSVAAATGVKMTQSELIRPKVNRKVGPLEQTVDAWRKIGSDSTEMSLVAGQMVGPKIMQDYLNTAVRCASAALLNNAEALADVAAVATLPNLADALAKFGDAAGDVACWVMHSTIAFQLLKDIISNATAGYTALTNVAGVAIVEASIASFGRPIFVTDSPALIDTVATPDRYYTLGLTQDAVRIMQSEEQVIVSELVTGLENLVWRIQGEHAFNVDVKGYSYTSATENPADAALATAANWTKVRYTKQGAGVILRTNLT